MKKDFTQPFKEDSLFVYLLVQDARSGMFFVWCDEDLFYSVLNFKLSKKDDLTLELAHYLYKNGFALNYYTELSRECEVTYSFIDDTSGVAEEAVCLHVVADESHIPPVPQKNIHLLTLKELRLELMQSPFGERVLTAGIDTLMYRTDTA